MKRAFEEISQKEGEQALSTTSTAASAVVAAGEVPAAAGEVVADAKKPKLDDTGTDPILLFKFKFIFIKN
jgi:hypothetical protein